MSEHIRSQVRAKEVKVGDFLVLRETERYPVMAVTRIEGGQLLIKLDGSVIGVETPPEAFFSVDRPSILGEVHRAS